MLTLQEKVIERTKVFAQQVETLRFSCDCYIYNPLSYAWPMHELYIRNYLSRPVRILLLGMNPGPWGMTQTGVPFGEIEAVKHFLKLEAEIAKPLVDILPDRCWGWHRHEAKSAEDGFGDCLPSITAPPKLSRRRWRSPIIVRWSLWTGNLLLRTSPQICWRGVNGSPLRQFATVICLM